MKKLLILINLYKAKKHFWNRLKYRGGSLWYFLLAKNDNNTRYRYKNHVFLVRDNTLATYIDKSINRHGNLRTNICGERKTKLIPTSAVSSAVPQKKDTKATAYV